MPGDMPAASLSCDLDNVWSYLKTHGSAEWRSYPSYLSEAVPRILELFADLDVSATVFVVGKDLESKADAEAIAEISRQGHELANHSYLHDPSLAQSDPDRIVAELERTEDLLAQVTGTRPVGYRGPGFGVSLQLLQILAARGYLYDATTLPTWIGPVARAYYTRRSPHAGQEEARPDTLYGPASRVFTPLTPYFWDVGSGTAALVEVPITTMPLVRAPMHLTYLLYLHAIRPRLAELYLSMGLSLCRLRGVAPSILIHPLDLLGADDCPALSFFPGMTIPGKEKRRATRALLTQLADRYSVVPVGKYAREVQQRALPTRSADTLLGRGPPRAAAEDWRAVGMR